MRGAVSAMSLAFLLLSLGVSVAAPQDERVLVPKGSVRMGTDPAELEAQLGSKVVNPAWYADETPAKQVEVGAFMIDVTEVTNKRYRSLVPAFKFPENLVDHPVVNVTWQEASDFCRLAGGRLPTEAEWERAARGDANSVYPWGNTFDKTKAVFIDTPGAGKQKVGSYAQGETGENLLGGTHPVASIEAGKSPFGLYDMAGNVWEWVDGWYDQGKMLRILKGGSWLSPRESLRSAARLPDGMVGDRRFNDYGFRCAYDVK